MKQEMFAQEMYREIPAYESLDYPQSAEREKLYVAPLALKQKDRTMVLLAISGAIVAASAVALMSAWVTIPHNEAVVLLKVIVILALLVAGFGCLMILHSLSVDAAKERALHILHAQRAANAWREQVKRTAESVAAAAKAKRIY